MPIIAELINHDELYERILATGGKPIIINDLPYTTEADKERIKELTITQLTSDTISVVPTCGGSCGKTRGAWALGQECRHCGNVVKTAIVDSSQSLLWMRAPKGVDALMSLVVWQMLSSYFTKNNHNAIAYLTDPLYTSASRTPIEMTKLASRGHERDYNYFIRNFEVIIEDLILIFPEKPHKPFSELREFLHKNHDCIFSRFMPLPSKSLFIADKTILGIYIEDSIQEALDTIYHMVSIDNEFYDKSPKTIVNRTARVIARQASFSDSYIRTNFQPKPAHYRRNVSGSRSIFAARAVVTSITGDHDYNVVKIPWRVAVPMFAHHLKGKLMRYGFNLNGACGHLVRHVAVYDELIHKFLDEIFIEETANGKGPAVLLNRN